MSSGCRYQRAIKQSLNKVFDNCSSVHSIIATIIASYSHKTLVRRGSYMFAPQRGFFIVQDVLSQHWVLGFFCPAKFELMNTSLGLRHYYLPDTRHKTRVRKKRVFDPFGDPSVHIRRQKFLLENKLRNEQMSHQAQIFA